MSAQAVTGAAAGIDAAEQAVVARVQQLQALIQAAGQVASPSSSTQATGAVATGPGTDFAAALQAATTADASGVASQPALTGTGSGGESGQYESLIAQAAARNGVDPAVLHGLIQQESAFDPSATSSAGAAGLTQLMPGTASSMGVANPLNPAESIEGGARYLGQLMSEFAGNTTDALAAYNAGPGAVQRYGGVPPYSETQSYVSKVLGYAETYRQSHPAAITAGALT
jgi:soluble lytic murein transglycosylase-like protein